MEYIRCSILINEICSFLLDVHSYNKRAAFTAEIQDGKHFGTQAYFKESNFKGFIDIHEGKLITNVVIGFSLYGAVAYDKDELMEQIGGVR